MPEITVNGLNANYTDTGPATGETILLLHAGGTSSAHWRKVAPLLDGDVRLIAPDLIGFGETDSWRGDRELTHDDQADLVAGLLDHLDVGPVHVVGHSYGGATSTRLALRYPELLKGLVLIEPVLTPLLHQSGDSALFQSTRILACAFITDAEAGRFEAAWRRFIDNHNGDGTWNGLSETARDRFLAMTMETADAYKSNMNNVTTLTDLMGLAAPTMVVSGEATCKSFRRICAIVRERVPGCADRIIDGAGHMSPLTHPQTVAAVIKGHVEIANWCAMRKTAA